MSNDTLLWGPYVLAVQATADGNGALDLSGVEPIEPINLRIAPDPYPHLRDDEGCILARDYIHVGKLAWILAKVNHP